MVEGNQDKLSGTGTEHQTKKVTICCFNVDQERGGKDTFYFLCVCVCLILPSFSIYSGQGPFTWNLQIQVLFYQRGYVCMYVFVCVCTIVNIKILIFYLRQAKKHLINISKLEIILWRLIFQYYFPAATHFTHQAIIMKIILMI